jgi:large conductance mechanosensitive channel
VWHHRAGRTIAGGAAARIGDDNLRRHLPGWERPRRRFLDAGGAATKQRRGSMLKEFRDFAMRGNLVDMAVGIIMGTAFGGLVNSLVNDIIMPVVGTITGGMNFTNFFIILSRPPGSQLLTLEDAKKAGAATLNFGLFINLIINFIIVAFVMFLLIKAMNKTRKQAPPAEPPAPPRSEVLLAEIRDLLKKPA